MGSGLFRIGTWCTRHRRVVVGGWVVAIIVLAVVGLAVKQPTSNAFNIPGTESQQALDLLNEKFPGTGGAQAQVVFSVPSPRTLTSAESRQAVESTLAELKNLPQVVGVTDPYGTGTVSKDGRIAYATVAYPVPVANVTAAAQSALLHSGAPAKAAGIAVNFGGQVAQANTTTDTEFVGLIIAFLVLLIGFGSLFAGIVPLVAALAGVAATNLALMALTAVINQSSTTSILATMIGLAVGIDYSLFVLNRHRQQLVDGAGVEESIGRAVATSGSAVCFAGTTVLIALAALSIVNIPFLTVMGLAAAGAVVVAVLAAITLVPALLGFTGTRLLSSHWARHKVAKASAPGYEPWSWKYVTTLKRAPILVVLAGIIVLLVVATPFLHMRLGLPDAGSQPTSQTTRRAYDLISEGFGPGANGPLLVVVYSPGGITPRQKEAFTSFYEEQKAHLPPDVASIGPPIPNPAGNVLLVEVIPKTGPNSPATTTLIDNIRTTVARGKSEYGLDTYVTGQTALNVDISAKLSSALPLYLGVIIALCLVLLVLVFRSLLVPVTAVIGYVVSVLAALGAVTWVFQEGHLSGLFGIARPGPVLSFLPIVLLGILFGLAMDYEVFLESRMREESLRKDARTAVTDGYTGSAKVVTSAAVIMISVFASFIFSPDPTTKSLGFALALGVLIDAFVIRMTVVPASMYIFGTSAWWLPRWLARVLPDLDVEGRAVSAPASSSPPSPTPPPAAGAPAAPETV
ncbi:MAG TPA: MMPL family transporter [Acidimicrobiales bacterium]|nr:MMPL family transporter [Acidimicrobiales bacterium]